MKLKVEFTTKFKKDLKLAQKRNLKTDKLFYIIEKLASSEPLNSKHKDHQLINYDNKRTTRECHIEPDWLLIYSINNDKLILILIRTGSHSDLF